MADKGQVWISLGDQKGAPLKFELMIGKSLNKRVDSIWAAIDGLGGFD